jgi:hypothetical protein
MMSVLHDLAKDGADLELAQGTQRFRVRGASGRTIRTVHASTIYALRRRGWLGLYEITEAGRAAAPCADTK